MLIHRLIVRKTKPEIEIIRDISFNHKGLSLIVDNTSDSAKDSGNNVGKTTVVKIIDLCLGAKSVRSLYFDVDTKSENHEIREFLMEHKVEAELILVDPNKKKKSSIVRQLFNRGKRIIDSIEFTQEEFWGKLKLLLFDLDEHNPTLRQLIPKFVRVDNITSENMIKYLGNTTSNDTYDSIYLFLFRIIKNDLLSKKDTLSANLKEVETKIRLLQHDENISSLDILEQRKQLIDSDLVELSTKRKNLDYMETYKEELKNKRNIINSINEVEAEMQMLQFEIKQITVNIEKLENEKSNINHSQISYIYNEAKAYIGTVNKTFEDLLLFHNKMIQNRIDFVKDQLTIKEKRYTELEYGRDTLLEQNKNLTIDLLDEGLLEELNSINQKIEALVLEKGAINQTIKILTSAETLKDNLTNDIKQISQQMDSNNINDIIGKFNVYFSDYCEKLYGEKYLFVYNSKWKEQNKFPVSLDLFKGNVGTGMKKGIIVAFDLAYIKFAEEMSIVSPRFVIHDKLENTHINQLRTIFELSRDINGQYIVPILRERVDKIESALIEECKVLELSKDEKFFKV
ncbi:MULTISPECIES: DUF2326 domain-containing protein [Paenibacillaceae]|uniref:Uncharacterized protein YydD, contains DUF2326 domain n=2 Tax=Paenibacillaceae TaxID=186822 RepID=A0A1G7HUG0_9BACL|nr:MULTISPECIES: DUF2326 domain-containing protein [Paenibacillaceae]QWU14885.1 DUF2326 domain-containing protein [Paenibacillus sophorae]SDF03699.1 Uncharacterized protein YydD, contains DUF2326 domain [Fontibacillus panacisegetis]SEO59255.1 Uncharacterized protein YydD, contains DUF2326 domain [Paenibacillus sophorae]